MYTWHYKILVVLTFAKGLGYAQRTQEMALMQYFEGRIAYLEDRMTRYEQDIRTQEQKMYDLSKETQAQLNSMSTYKSEVTSQVDGVVMRVERVERDIEYLENLSPAQPCVEMEEKLLEQQEKEVQNRLVTKLSKGTDCNTMLAGVKSVKIVKWTAETHGSWMRDSSKGSEKIYFFSGTTNSTLLEFATLKAFTEGNFSHVARRVQLPFPGQGAGFVGHSGFLYYHRAGTPNEVVKVHVRNRTVSDRLLLQGAGRLPAYSLSPHTLVDLAVDELGLWAIHADTDLWGNLVLTKLDWSLAVEGAWDTTCSSQDAEASFLVCGTLYVVYSPRHGGRSSVRCQYDIHDIGRSGEITPLFFPKHFASHSSLKYHPKEKQIYAWDDGYQNIYKLDTNRKSLTTS